MLILPAAFTVLTLALAASANITYNVGLGKRSSTSEESGVDTKFYVAFKLGHPDTAYWDSCSKSGKVSSSNYVAAYPDQKSLPGPPYAV